MRSYGRHGASPLARSLDMNQHSPKLAEPHFRIGVGQKHGFFTLQEWHQEPIYKVDYRGTRLAGIEWKSSHIVNLSQDYQEALIKAKRLAHMHSMTLRASESKEETLDAIARRDRESIAADNLREAQKLDSKLFWFDSAVIVCNLGQI